MNAQSAPIGGEFVKPLYHPVTVALMFVHVLYFQPPPATSNPPFETRFSGTVSDTRSSATSSSHAQPVV